MNSLKCKNLSRYGFLFLILILSGTMAFAQKVTVKGTVKDVNGESIPGANVIVKGTSNGIVTDFDGNYMITVNGSKTLIFTFIGYTSKEVKINGKTKIDVVLKEDFHQLEEVVAVGYGSMKKADLTGSVVSVKADDLQKAPVANVEQALMGRAAGVRISSMEGKPGEALSIEIRGGSSIGGSNSPLYVIDGFPVGEDGASLIDPADVESIQILKDASSTAIYGARGANGVVLITTKSGAKGEPKLEYSGYVGIQKVGENYPDVLNAEQWAQLMHEREPNGEQYLNPAAYADSTQVNWRDEILRTAMINNHHISLAGGQNKSKYNASVSYLDQEGVVIRSGYKRYTGRINLSQKIGKKLNVKLNASYTYGEQTGNPSQGGSGSRFYIRAAQGRPYVPSTVDIEDEDYLNDENGNPNPLADINSTDFLVRKENLSVNGIIDYEIIKGLNYTFKLGNRGTNNKTKKFEKPPSYNGRNKNGAAFQQHTTSQTWLNENLLSFKRKFAKHDINAVVGYTRQGYWTENLKAANSNFPYFNLGYDNLGVGTVYEAPSSSYKEWGLESFLSRVNYTFNNKYLFTVAFRRDGSSRFADGNKWANFPSGAFSWRISEEDFMKDLSFISNMKARVSWGETGNLRVSPYDSMSQLKTENYSLNNGISAGIVPSTLASPELQWETTNQTDIGLDVGFLDNRIILTADYYYKKTNDLLLNANITGLSGFKTMMRNVGSMENKGLELLLSTVNIKNKQFTWSTDINISFNKNKVIELADGQESFFVNRNYTGVNQAAFIVKKGEALGSMYGYVWDGIYNYDDFNISGEGANKTYALKQDVAQLPGSVKPGDIKYKDINGDGVINDKDRTIIGDGNPVHFGGITNNFRYKNFDLSVFFEWSYGNDIMNATRFKLEAMNGRANQYATVLDRFRPEVYDEEGNLVDAGNSNTTMYSEDGNTSRLVSDRVVEDGSYIKLKTASFGYTFPKKMVKRLGLGNLRVYVSGQNLWTITNYSGNDPDVFADNTWTPSKGLLKGVDYGAYPTATTVTFGAKVTF
ncbi:TonB-dependent receptor [Puteibacter caeruleilacunae]|nr:TonB-dependent receptor [Puteibacter caeruleilacunae]